MKLHGEVSHRSRQCPGNPGLRPQTTNPDRLLQFKPLPPQEVAAPWIKFDFAAGPEPNRADGCACSPLSQSSLDDAVGPRLQPLNAQRPTANCGSLWGEAGLCVSVIILACFRALALTWVRRPGARPGQERDALPGQEPDALQGRDALPEQEWDVRPEQQQGEPQEPERGALPERGVPQEQEPGVPQE